MLSRKDFDTAIHDRDNFLPLLFVSIISSVPLWAGVPFYFYIDSKLKIWHEIFLKSSNSVIFFNYPLIISSFIVSGLGVYFFFRLNVFFLRLIPGLKNYINYYTLSSCYRIKDSFYEEYIRRYKSSDLLEKFVLWISIFLFLFLFGFNISISEVGVKFRFYRIPYSEWKWEEISKIEYRVYVKEFGKSKVRRINTEINLIKANETLELYSKKQKIHVQELERIIYFSKKNKFLQLYNDNIYSVDLKDYLDTKDSQFFQSEIYQFFQVFERFKN